MKKITALILACFMFLISFAACSDSKNGTNDRPATDTGLSSDDKGQSAQKSVFQTVDDEKEYELYHEIFFDKKGGDYENKEAEKTGTFATLYDEFNKVKRYYVWGYGDDKGSDWQWELRIKGASKLPKNGSLVTVTGTFEKSEDALDGYWFTDPEITVKTAYEGKTYDVDMSVMSATLERVQIANMQSFKEEFEDKSVAVYGRLVSENLILHPYSDESWQQHFFTDGKLPEEGTMVLVTGVFSEGVIKEAAVTETSQY
ncbi:MAG: hypothetical protein ACI4F5_07895 [Acutalibacteraceae bacterium]